MRPQRPGPCGRTFRWRRSVEVDQPFLGQRHVVRPAGRGVAHEVAKPHDLQLVVQCIDLADEPVAHPPDPGHELARGAEDRGARQPARVGGRVAVAEPRHQPGAEQVAPDHVAVDAAVDPAGEPERRLGRAGLGQRRGDRIVHQHPEHLHLAEQQVRVGERVRDQHLAAGLDRPGVDMRAGRARQVARGAPGRRRRRRPRPADPEQVPSGARLERHLVAEGVVLRPVPVDQPEVEQVAGGTVSRVGKSRSCTTNCAR